MMQPERDQTLRIAVYMNDLSGGGTERTNLELIEQWRTAGHAVTLLLHARDGELAEQLPPDLPVVEFATHRSIADVMPLARFLRHRPTDILITSLDHNNIVGILAKLLARIQTPIIICQHNPFINDAARITSWTYHALPLLYRLLVPAAAGVVAVSEGVAADFSRVTRRPAKDITTIYNPIIGQSFTARANQALSHHWFDTDEPVYITAGRLVKQKNHAHLLRSFAKHCTEGGRGRLMILGDGPLRADLEQLATHLCIRQRTKFEGFVQNPLPYIRQAAAFVLSSRYEGFGNVLVEALGVGTPVISVDCNFGPSEILANGRFGRLVPNDDVDALASAFSPELRTIWPAEMLRARAGDFTAAASARRYLDLMRKLVVPHAHEGPRVASLKEAA
jgi:glycosyltransferase involved in cell wall biosynthesis